MKLFNLPTTVALFFTIALSACAKQTDASDSSKENGEIEKSNDIQQTIVQKAQSDLSERLKNADSEVVSIEKVVWSDGSMGCPKPGMSYTQALVEGYKVVLMSNGKQYVYHGNNRGYVFLCDNPSRPIKNQNPAF